MPATLDRAALADARTYPWSADDLAALPELVAAGLTDRAIGRRLGRTLKGVERMRRRLKLAKHGTTRARVLALLARGWPVWRVADAVGRTETQVRLIRRRAG